ncbi:MAG: hypothetical protein IKP05_01185 [Alphaproteobacteria bacterium]|nr:hypothetical protein [Alphaproteobacteria bacterium]
MERYTRFCWFLGILVCLPCFATTDIVAVQKSGDRYMTLDTIIEPGGSFVDGTIYIQNSLNIVNNGQITSALNVCNNCNVYIENTGIYNAAATLGTNATITQVIKNAADITTLTNIGAGNYGVLVQDTATTLNWNTIKNTTIGANKFEFDNAKLEMGLIESISNVRITNNLFIHTHDVINTDTLLFANVSGDGVVYVDSDNLDIMYELETYKVTNSIFVRTVRSGDYGRILNNGAGRFLNQLRIDLPEDKLLNKMDKAKTMSELKHIMSRSVRLNPIKLLQPIKTLYAHKMLETMHIDDDTVFGFMPFGVFSDDIILNGAGPRISTKISDDLHLTISGYFADLEYSDDINEYTGSSYGIGLDIVDNLSSDNFVRIYGDVGFSHFNAGPIFNGRKTKKNPDGFSGYMAGEFGHKFDVDEYYVTPFIMVGSEYTEVLNDNVLDTYVGAGANAGFDLEIDGLRYDYMARSIVRSDGGFGASVNISVWSGLDAAGADFGVGVFYDNVSGPSYRASINGKFGF